MSNVVLMTWKVECIIAYNHIRINTMSEAMEVISKEFWIHYKTRRIMALHY
jgi:hypothetical protein